MYKCRQWILYTRQYNIHENKLDAHIPNRKQAHEAKIDIKDIKTFSKHNFEYDHQNNQYICPNNKELSYQKTYKYNNKIRQQYYTNECLKCPDQTKCAGKRKETVEWPFGNIKQNLKFTEYYTRGLKQIQTENNLIYISHNLKRIFNTITKPLKQILPNTTKTI
jgi:hypothetical protein